jgi:hypothetical protein
MSDVTFVQDGLAHRAYRYLTDEERISLACQPDGSQPVDLFDVVLLQTVGPLRRCVNCYLDSDMLTTVCDRHSTWGRVGESVSCQQCADDPKVIVQGQGPIWAEDPGANVAWKKIMREAMAQVDPNDVGTWGPGTSGDGVRLHRGPQPQYVVMDEASLRGGIDIDIDMSRKAARSMRDFLVSERYATQVRRPGETPTFTHVTET